MSENSLHNNGIADTDQLSVPLGLGSFLQPADELKQSQDQGDSHRPAPGDANYVPTFERHSFQELVNRNDKEWLIDQVAGRGDVFMIYGQPGSGKTFIAIDMVFAAALGRQWADRAHRATYARSI